MCFNVNKLYVNLPLTNDALLPAFDGFCPTGTHADIYLQLALVLLWFNVNCCTACLIGADSSIFAYNS